MNDALSTNLRNITIRPVLPVTVGMAGSALLMATAHRMIPQGKSGATLIQMWIREHPLPRTAPMKA